MVVNKGNPTKPIEIRLPFEQPALEAKAPSPEAVIIRWAIFATNKQSETAIRRALYRPHRSPTSGESIKITSQPIATTDEPVIRAEITDVIVRSGTPFHPSATVKRKERRAFGSTRSLADPKDRSPSRIKSAAVALSGHFKRHLQRPADTSGLQIVRREPKEKQREPIQMEPLKFLFVVLLSSSWVTLLLVSANFDAR